LIVVKEVLVASAFGSRARNGRMLCIRRHCSRYGKANAHEIQLNHVEQLDKRYHKCTQRRRMQAFISSLRSKRRKTYLADIDFSDYTCKRPNRPVTPPHIVTCDRTKRTKEISHAAARFRVWAKGAS
jgi:hypothetical protein